MAVYTKFLPGDINIQLFADEISALAGNTLDGLDVRGFDTSGKATKSPRFTERKVVGFSRQLGNVVNDEADPGEVKITLSVTLSAGQEAALDAAIAAHDPDALTTDQQDRADIEAEFIAVFDVLRTVNFEALPNNAARASALRKAVLFLGKRVFQLNIRPSE